MRLAGRFLSGGIRLRFRSRAIAKCPPRSERIRDLCSNDRGDLEKDSRRAVLHYFRRLHFVKPVQATYTFFFRTLHPMGRTQKKEEQYQQIGAPLSSNWRFSA